MNWLDNVIGSYMNRCSELSRRPEQPQHTLAWKMYALKLKYILWKRKKLAKICQSVKTKNWWLTRLMDWRHRELLNWFEWHEINHNKNFDITRIARKKIGIVEFRKALMRDTYKVENVPILTEFDSIQNDHQVIESDHEVVKARKAKSSRNSS
jgi:hypothetical protein